MAVRVTSRVGNNAAVTTGPVGGLVLLGLCALVLGGIVGWALPAVMLLLKLAFVALGVGCAWLGWFIYREVKLQRAWDALSAEEKQRAREREAQRSRERTDAYIATLRERRESMRPADWTET